MKPTLVITGLALALLARPAAAQAHVSVVVGVNVPPVHGTVVVGTPYPASRHPVVVVAPRYPRYYRGGAVVVRRGHPHGRGHGHAYGHRHHRHSRWH